MKPVAPSSRAELLAEQISGAIADGSIAPGTQLHQENLAERYGVSRSPVREALRLLEARGLVTYHPNRGAAVAAIDAEQVCEILEIRRLLEPRLVARSAAVISANDVRELRAVLERCEAAGDAATWNALHRSFHERIYAAAERPRMLEIVSDNRVPFSNLSDFTTVAPGLQAGYGPSDRALLSALEQHDAAAAMAATLAHLDALEERAMQRFRGA